MGTNGNGIRRFPRLPGGKTLETAPILFGHGERHLSRIEKFQERIARGDIPRGYDRLTHKQKKVIKLIASGYGIEEACKKISMSRETFYRLRRAHPMFREYLNKQLAKNLADVDSRLERQVIRASQVIDEALDMEDPYFTATVATNVLKGRGRWKTSSTSKVEHGGKVGLEGSLTVDDHGVTKELITSLVQGFVQMASGAPAVNEMKTITVEKDVKALPPAPESKRAAS